MKPKRGPYTLPLPPLPDGRPQWLKQGYADHNGRETPLWAIRYPKIKHYRLERTWEVPETVNELTGLPIRSGGVQAWDHEKGRWVACPNRGAVKRYLRRVGV